MQRDESASRLTDSKDILVDIRAVISSGGQVVQRGR